MKQETKSLETASPREHISQLIEWMSQGVYEKEHIIAMALLCAIAGENMFLLGPPGTAKSMVASRLKMVFKDGKSFDYLMSRFSTPDEIFGPISISRLKNNDRYERLTAEYLPEADVVFLDEIWKAGPSIQNTLLTVINEHIFHNGGHTIKTPMKVLIAASNELPAKDEGLEALWDRFLIRMVSNGIENEAVFFKMIKTSGAELEPLAKQLYITDELYSFWQKESCKVELHETVANAITNLRKNLAKLEKEDGNKLRYYISDRRWRKAYRLMQTSAYLNERTEINLSDYLLLIYSFWNDVECIPIILQAFVSSITQIIGQELDKIDNTLREVMSIPNSSPNQNLTQAAGSDNLEESENFYYIIDNYLEEETLFSKWHYMSLTNHPKPALRYYDTKRKKYIIQSVTWAQSNNIPNQDSSAVTEVEIQRVLNGIIIDGIPYQFRLKNSLNNPESNQPQTSSERIKLTQTLFNECVNSMAQMLKSSFTTTHNIFLSSNDFEIVQKINSEIKQRIKATEAKLNNVSLLIK